MLTLEQLKQIEEILNTQTCDIVPSSKTIGECFPELATAISNAINAIEHPPTPTGSDINQF